VDVQDKELQDYDKADIAMALARMVSYNIGHLAYMNAKLHNLSRVIFGGFFIRRNPYTMETIDYALRFWSKVRSQAHGIIVRCG
jgi:pantothenate kinase